MDISTTSEGIEPVAAVLLELNLGYSVQDKEDFKSFLQGNDSHWDYIDDDLMNLSHAPTILTVYLTDKAQGVAQLATITRELDRLKFLANNEEWGSLSYSLSGVEEEEWATAWKAYYKPIEISDKLVICPEWIDYPQKSGQTVLKIDPGMAFGTGTHESTKMCLEFISHLVTGGESILDVGCGSGILSISAVLLGAAGGLGSDIDQLAAEIAQQNAQLNGVDDRLVYGEGSFAEGISGSFDMVFANIVASAIIAFAPDLSRVLKKGGKFICSGIIDERADEVKSALLNLGFKHIETKKEKGWVAYLFTY